MARLNVVNSGSSGAMDSLNSAGAKFKVTALYVKRGRISQTLTFSTGNPDPDSKI